MNQRTVTVSLELLRPGPAHNHLLSPLTNYLAIASDASAAVVHVPYEHAELLRKMEALRYSFLIDPGGSDDRVLRHAEEDRRHSINELSLKLTDALAHVPGWREHLSPGGGERDFIHVEVVVSAAELAMLPFELLSVPGAPGQFLLLGGNPSVCLTRRVRNVSRPRAEWYRPPKILFIPAMPAGRAIPLDAHLRALLKALSPWVLSAEDDGARFLERFKSHVTVLEAPTIAKIADAFTRDEYTHVHVLAHGAPAEGGGFGVALVGENRGEAHVVTGAQLAGALRSGGRNGPSVCTLAMCNSGAIEDVVFTGASFAHELHRSGIPFVVGSQFPLSFEGSAILTDELYTHLLGGEDPRIAVVHARRQLFARYAGKNHDWASVVAYAALPADLDEQLERTRYQQARSATEAALCYADDLITKGTEDGERKLQRATAVVEKAAKSLALDGRYRSEGLGLRGAASKRLAEAMFRAARAGSPNADKLSQGSVKRLDESLQWYAQATAEVLKHRPGEPVQVGAIHWVLTQYMVLELILKGESHPEHASTARLTAEADAHLGTTLDARIWGISTLIELAVLRAWQNGGADVADAFRNADILVNLARGHSSLSATARQLRRYAEWWWSPDFIASLGPATRTVQPKSELRDAVLKLAGCLKSES